MYFKTCGFIRWCFMAFAVWRSTEQLAAVWKLSILIDRQFNSRMELILIDRNRLIKLARSRLKTTLALAVQLEQ
jgi:hypothetical protein